MDEVLKTFLATITGLAIVFSILYMIYAFSGLEDELEMRNTNCINAGYEGYDYGNCYRTRIVCSRYENQTHQKCTQVEKYFP